MRSAASRASLRAGGSDDEAIASARRGAAIPPDSAYAGPSTPGEAPHMVFGRRNERAVLDRVLAGARCGRGSTIVIHGEPGIGKSTLLSYAIGSAAGFRVLRAVGHEAESELPFSAAQQLGVPGLAALGQLPAPQREALGVAFGQVEGPAPDRLLVGLALLGLLSALASETPVLCVIDDAQWLDRESARAVAFVARRLGSERIAFVFGARAVPGDLGGLPDVLVEGLGRADARALLRSGLPGPFDEHVLERILAEARGNPLALLELPHGLTAAELAGGFGLPVSVPMTGRIQASYRRRIARLPALSPAPAPARCGRADRRSGPALARSPVPRSRALRGCRG
jgi:AAA ATPase domain